MNIRASEYADCISLLFPQDKLFDMIAVLDSGIKRKGIQLAHYLELEQTVAPEILERQIQFSKTVLSKLEDLLEYPTEEELNALIDSMDTPND